MKNDETNRAGHSPAPLDTSTHDQFYQYYREQSLSPEAIERFNRLASLILKTMRIEAGRERSFRIADIGGGAGTLARIFARAGHEVTCVDLSKDLLEEGRRRAAEEGLVIDFINCSATQTPLPDASLDICVIPELLEHIVAWAECLDEASRILKPGGLLYLSTTNKLCPIQEEFELPLYSWYPGFLKRRYEHLAVTTRPEISNYAKYPAVNWFTFYQLRSALTERGFSRFLDRLDMIEIMAEESFKVSVAKFLQATPFCRAAVQCVTDGSYIIAFKAPEASG